MSVLKLCQIFPSRVTVARADVKLSTLPAVGPELRSPSAGVGQRLRAAESSTLIRAAGFSGSCCGFKSGSPEAGSAHKLITGCCWHWN
jgi:hypothetical protein